MSFSTLVSAPQLRELMGSGDNVVVLDTSFDLVDLGAGERSHAEAHLPGAHYLHLERDLSGPKTGRNGRHPLPTREAFAATAGRVGVTPDTQVIVYDRQGAMFAARAWWMLRWLGHEAVALLDGGLAAWQQAGGAVQSGAVTSPGLPPYRLRTPLVKTIEAAELAASLGTQPLIDARAPERFRGEVEPLDAQAGHIPGARNRFFKDNLTPDGRFKPADELRAAFGPLAGADPSRVVHQCGSGATACHNIFAMRLAGFGETSLYPGSWSEWSSDPTRPVAKG
jgi:thiosulfate/3-mercaptopyruvate sulfurtransferase